MSILGFKKIRCGGPINFDQWKLDSQARGLRMIVDELGDIVAFPVVVVDPSTDLAGVQGVSEGTRWSDAATITAAGVTTLHVPTAPNTISYLYGLFLDYSDAVLAVAGLDSFYIAEIGPPSPYRWGHQYWLDTTASFRPSLPMDFSRHPLQGRNGFNVAHGVALAGGSELILRAWGYDR